MEFVENLNRRYIRASIESGGKDGLEGYRIRMLQGNKIAGLLRVDKRYIDGQGYLYYDITGMYSMRDLQYTITLDVMDGFIRDLETLCKNLEDYLLKQQEVCLLPEYIWRQEGGGKWNFVYIPEDNREKSSDMERLLEFIMDHVDSSDENGLERFYDFYSGALQCLERLDVGEMIRLWKKDETLPKLPDKREGDLERLQEEKELMDIERDVAESDCREIAKYKGRIYTVPFHGIKVL